MWYRMNDRCVVHVIQIPSSNMMKTTLDKKRHSLCAPYDHRQIPDKGIVIKLDCYLVICMLSVISLEHSFSLLTAKYLVNRNKFLSMA